MLFYQLCGRNYVPVCSVLTRSSRYVNKDRGITKKLVQHAERRGVKGLFITVDAPQLGRREKVRFLIAPDAGTLTGKAVRTCE